MGKDLGVSAWSILAITTTFRDKEVMMQTCARGDRQTWQDDEDDGGVGGGDDAVVVDEDGQPPTGGNAGGA